MPKVSVVMTVYNTERYLIETIESILSQTLSDFEFIIIDDWSTDSSREIIQKYTKEDKRINAIKNERNLWVVINRKKMNELSNTDYVAVIDSDDVALPQRLQKQYDFLKRNPDVAVVWSHIIIIDKDSDERARRKYPITEKDMQYTIFKKSPLAQPSVMMRKSIIVNVWWYDKNYERAQDYELWTRLVDKWYKIANIDDFLVKYRVFNEQWKFKHLHLTLKNTIKIQNKYIWKKKYFTLSNMLYFFAECSLFFLPRETVLSLFKKIEYGK